MFFCGDAQSERVAMPLDTQTGVEGNSGDWIEFWEVLVYG